MYVYFNIYLSLSVYIGPEKPQWGVANHVYTHRYLVNPSLKSCIRPRDLKFTLPLLTNVLAN